MPAPADNERLRRLIADYFGGGSRLRILRQTAAFGAPVFVVDFDRGVRHYRTLGSFGPTFGAIIPTRRRSQNNRAWTCSTRRIWFSITSG